jgi:hypothetical protein
VGKRVVFTVTVINLGPDDAEGVVVYAWFGDDKVKKTVGEVKVDEPVNVEIEWLPLEEGTVTVRIVVNPPEEEGSIWELDYTNNQWSQNMKVGPAEGDDITQNLFFWIAIIVLLVVIFGVLYAIYSRGGGGEGGDAGYYDDEEGEPEEEGDEEEEYDEDLEDEGEEAEYEDEYEDEEYVDEEDLAEDDEEVLEVKSAPRSEPKKPPKKPDDDGAGIALTVGRM